MVEFRIGIRIYMNFVNSYISTPTGIPIRTLYRRKLQNPTRNRIFYPIYRMVYEFFARNRVHELVVDEKLSVFH